VWIIVDRQPQEWVHNPDYGFAIAFMFFICLVGVIEDSGSVGVLCFFLSILRNSGCVRSGTLVRLRSLEASIHVGLETKNNVVK
jgi:hypothetical protein